METGPEPGLRAITRAITRDEVRARITRTAEELFLTRGYDKTTVDQIAGAVGMSQRSFFRYFASKDDIVLDTYDRLGRDLLGRLVARPEAESDWVSLRRTFDVVTEQLADPEVRVHGAAVQRLVDSTPGLLAPYLQRLDGIQQRMTGQLAARAADQGRTADPVVLRATVGAAFACLQAAISHASGHEPTALPDLLDAAMDSVRGADVVA
ncbi:TetR/AcrR family transcriptional regulator [Streptomyces profundus]|uniref:TetR/AcrR family transcriptional regulator n=1 Tax=Streptomyces profundus TaxID=2867410 RepID=UPI001D161D58|nr:TetR/AcrR family transcriptional regulator [Streptomyces sp. MA3_2.13]UED87845.1 TetR/AcrR family transcriptional regulator [Streptomyces sp. MA3_2.13]